MKSLNTFKIAALLVIALSALTLPSCITVPSDSELQAPTPKDTPPEGATEPCDSLAEMATDRPTEPSEAWTIILQNNGVLLDCKTRYDYLRGWVAGRASKPTEQKEPKRKFLGLF